MLFYCLPTNCLEHLFQVLRSHAPHPYNINDKAGSTHLEGLAKQVKKLKADVGIAYDGDADRCLMIDENGEEVDGDKIMAISALSLKKNKKYHMVRLYHNVR